MTLRELVRTPSQLHTTAGSLLVIAGLLDPEALPDDPHQAFLARLLVRRVVFALRQRPESRLADAAALLGAPAAAILEAMREAGLRLPYDLRVWLDSPATDAYRARLSAALADALEHPAVGELVERLAAQSAAA
jgi:hypothetical protein